MSYAESGFAQFMATPSGRILRVVAGLLLILWGYTMRGTTSGVVLMIVGLIPLAAGAFDLCLVGVLFGGPVSGAKVRACRKT